MEAPGPPAPAQAQEAAVQLCCLKDVVSQGPSGYTCWALKPGPHRCGH